MRFTGKDRERGIQARQLLENEMFNECFDMQIEAITKQWQTETDPATRERLWYLLQGTEGAKDVLKSFIGKGSAAEKELAKKVKQ